MTYAEAIDFLYRLQQFGASFGLERTFKLAELVGRPQDRLRFIHVAGTNGKGSTCAMLEAIYRQAGYKTGLYTSPHLVSFAERIQVNRQLIPEAEVARLAACIQDLLGKFPGGEQATFFEVVTVMALCWFAEQKCDIVIWETGLGGRLDATNIVTPLASVITNIQRDHQKWLGNTVAEIAREKAGIIKAGVPIFTAIEDEAALGVIEEVARETKSSLTRVCQGWAQQTACWDDLEVSLKGAHQLKNARLAIAVAREVSKIRNPESALRNVSWPGRFDIRGRYILDGAHNPDGAIALRSALEQTFPGTRPAFVVGILADKDIAEMAKEFRKVASHFYTVSVHSDRAADASLLAEKFRAVAPELPVESCSSLAEALGKSESAERVVITGSLHFIGEAMEFLGFQAGQGNERGLNDWSANKIQEKGSKP